MHSVALPSPHQSVATIRFTHRLQWVTDSLFTTFSFQKSLNESQAWQPSKSCICRADCHWRVTEILSVCIKLEQHVSVRCLIVCSCQKKKTSCQSVKKRSAGSHTEKCNSEEVEQLLQPDLSCWWSHNEEKVSETECYKADCVIIRQGVWRFTLTAVSGRSICRVVVCNNQ